MSMSDSQAIRNAAVECRRSLEKCLDIPRLREGGWAENRLIDFGLWSEGAGVLAKGKLALDERLSTKLEVRNVIVKMLSLLNMFVESCQEKARESIDEVAHASDPKRERDDKTDEKEEHNFHETGLSHAEAEARKDVEETLNQIIRLTVAIRKAGSDSHLKRADRSFDKQNPKIQELRSLLELVIHPRGIKEEGLNEIQTRLIEANLRRRHRFTYAKVHSQKLARRDTEPRSKKEPFNSTIGAPVIKNLLQSENPLKPNLLLVDSNPRLELTDLPRPAPALTVTTAASAIEGTIILTEHKAPRAAATVISRITSRIAYPRPPPVSRDNQVFRCPCCCQSLPIFFTEPTQWKKHLAADILPYTCIFSDCLRPLQFYLSRIDWEDHIKTDHGQLWNCIVCDQLGDSTGHEFHQEKDIIQHLQTEHQDDVDTDEISMFVSASRSSKVTKTAGCPICPGPEDGQDTLEHIARCVHDFSLRSLPAPSEADGPEEYFDVGSRNNSSENVTSSLEGEERDFEGLPDLEFDSDHNTNAQHNQLTESSLKTIFHFFVPEDPRARLRAWISENNKVVGPGSGYINDSDFRRPLIAGDFDKRLRIPSSHPVDFDESIYNIGWVCTLPEEHHAGVAVLDRINTDEFVLNHNVYRLGAIGGHNVVMACFNATITGDIKRPSPLGSMLIEFPSIKIIFFVGVAGGIPPVSKVGATYTLQPTAQHPDIRLGDVVVGAPTEGHPPVAEINFDGKGDVTSYDVILEEIPLALRRFFPVSGTRVRHIDVSDTLFFFPPGDHRNDRLLPGPTPRGLLFRPDYFHKSFSADCKSCDQTMILREQASGSSYSYSAQVHYGMIFTAAESVTVPLRDRINRMFGCDALCVGLQDTGLLKGFPHIDIRGISSYLDSHDSGVWKPHAALAAATYAKLLLKMLAKDELGKYTVRQLAPFPSLRTGIKVSIEEEHLEQDSRVLDVLNLFSPRDHYATYVHHLQTAPSITSEWFLQNLNFKVWLQGQERGQTLYCEGIPGAGKSYMMSRVIQYLLELHSTDENIGIAFAYCSLDSQEGQTPENLFATLLKQLLAQHPGLKEILSVSKSNLSVSQVFEELASAITKFSRVYILIDALDESDYCLERGYDFYLKLRELQDRTGVNAFLTSRFPLSTVASHGLESDDTHGAKPKNLAALISRTMLFMQVRTNDLDIEQFALRLIDSGSALEVDEQIVRKISGQADGICFIAKLQVDSIADAKTIDEARSILENGSNSIRAYDSLYQKVMARLVSQDERHKSIGVVSLCWLFSAKRLLSKQELLAALNFHFESQVPSVLDIVRSGCGLITHTPTIFKICHPTAEEYLKRTQDYWIRGHWTPHYGHIIARRLVETLSKEKFQICLHEAGLRKRFEHHPLYGYAAQNWGYHLQEQTGPDPVVIQFLQNGDLVSAAAQALEAASVTSTNFPEYLFTDMKITGMHLAAYFGLRESLKTLLQADPMGIDQEDINWRTPLSWAARYGQYHTASLLLTRGANVDAKDIDGKTPLLWAVEGGYKEIVGLYVTVVPLTLGGGPKIYNTGSENDPLLVAIKLGHDGIALMLLDAFLSDTVSTIDRYWDRGPFFAASRYGRAKVVEALLERGANPDITDDLGHTPLMEAARWGQIAAVKAILYFYSSTTSGYRLRQALSKTNNFGQSAWELANAEHHWHVSRLLLYYKESL